MKASGTIKAKLAWVDASDQPAPNPHDYVNLRETASASSGDSTARNYVTFKGSVDNGIGSSHATDFSSTGRRFETLSTTGGTAETQVSLKASIDVDTGAGATVNGTTGYISARCSFAVEVLNHAPPCNFRKDPFWSPIDQGNAHLIFK